MGPGDGLLMSSRAILMAKAIGVRNTEVLR
jgi:hypothetical protein